jgi:adsorption protein B
VNAWYPIIDSILFRAVEVLAVAYTVLGIDDFILDAYAWIKGIRAGRDDLRAKLVSPGLKRQASGRPFAIAVAAWHEHEVIARMVRGNSARIDFDSYDYFIGVYPNDLQTQEAVQKLLSTFKNVHMVVNTKEGPTSKGQMLNQVIAAVIANETESARTFRALLIHDCEDLIHPQALTQVDLALETADFIQVPIFSLPVPARQLVAGTYMDEFAEIHSKDLRVRAHLTGCIPAAGVGMAMSRELLGKYFVKNQGQVFNESSLTEDYELGLRVPEYGGRCRLLVVEQMGDSKIFGERLVATREYFPKKFVRSIRQKTRWTTGIAFQGWKNLGWRGTWLQKYFLYRDRKGPFCNILSFIGLMIVSVYGIWSELPIAHRPMKSSHVFVLGLLTGVFMINRTFQRWFACYKLYGFKPAILSPLRILIGNVINACAALRAIWQYTKSQVFGSTLKWAKTEHELPADFGHVSASIVFALLILSATWASRASAADCVQIYYDASKDVNYTDGALNSVMLTNLIGHFPDLTPIVRPIETYVAGQIETCRATVYLATYYENQIPESFLSDFSSTKKNVAWVGTSLWLLGEAREKSSLGVKYLGLADLDQKNKDSKSRPTFFKTVRYKSELFEKYGEFAASDATRFNAEFEVTQVETVGPQATIMATIQHNGTKKTIPYAVRSGNHFFVADDPFSYIHESDRYLVFADLLFDILNEKPARRGPHPAVFRLEDIHDRVPAELVRVAAAIASENAVPMHVALIPIFVDPYGAIGPVVTSPISLETDVEFLKLLRELQNENVRFILHGVTHQHDMLKNPSGTSGDDFEFWDANQSAPLADDGVKSVLDRLDRGWTAVTAAGIQPKVWEVPHYLCSPLDSIIFARAFATTIGRVTYQAMTVTGQPFSDSGPLRYLNSGVGGSAARFADLQNLSVTTKGPVATQFFPYEIARDVYGQKVIPENLGYVIDPQVLGGGGRSVDDILIDAKRNLVLRDSWGSFFFHPYILKTEDGKNELRRLLKGLKALGYEFTDLDK